MLSDYLTMGMGRGSPGLVSPRVYEWNAPVDVGAHATLRAYIASSYGKARRIVQQDIRLAEARRRDRASAA